MSVKSPVIDSIAELRFTSTVPVQALVGIIYQSFNSDFNRVEDQPILSLPLEVRQAQPELMQQAHYRIYGEDFTVHIGPSVIAITPIIDQVNKFYPGWDVFGAFVDKVVSYLFEEEFVESVQRATVRYINFFDSEGLVEKTNIGVELAGKNISTKNLTVAFEDEDGDYRFNVQLAGKANVKNQSFNGNGAIVDISAYTETEVKQYDELKTKIEGLHSLVEDKFFDIVKKESLPEGVKKRAKK